MARIVKMEMEFDDMDVNDTSERVWSDNYRLLQQAAGRERLFP
jgi:hypothetical protein